MVGNKALTRLQSFGTAVHFILGIVAGGLWTGAGLVLAAAWSDTGVFLHEWVLLQGFPLVGLGTFFVLFSDPFRLGKFEHDLGCAHVDRKLSRPWRSMVILFVAGLGTVSLITMGFNGHSVTLYFMWVTAFVVCLVAAVATIRVAELLRFSARLVNCAPSLHFYSPANTPALRRIAEYASLFGVILTLGYAFSFAGTLAGNWTASPSLVRVVQVFWPMIYVPVCLATLAYPHLAVYRLVRDEKDRVISDLQRRILEISSSPRSLTNEDIGLLNSLADLVRKIDDTPNYPKNLRVLGGLIFTAVVNMASLLIPKEAVAKIIRHSVGF